MSIFIPIGLILDEVSWFDERERNLLILDIKTYYVYIYTDV